MTGYQVTSGLLQIFTGFMEKYIPRRILMAVGIIWGSIMTSVGGLVSPFNHLLTSRILAGIGSSVQHPVGSSMLAEKFRGKKLGTVMGINIGIGNIGGTMAVPVVAFLLYSVGWRGTLFAVGIPGLIIGLMFLWVRDVKTVKRDSNGSYGVTILQEFRRKPILVLTSVQAVISFRFGILAFIPVYLVSKGYSVDMSAYLYMFLLIGSAVGPFLWGSLSDRFQPRIIVIAVLAISGIMFYFFPSVNSVESLIPYLFVLGVTFQSVSAVIQGLIPKVTSVESVGSVFSLFYTIGFGLGLPSPLLIGYFADWFGFTFVYGYVGLLTLLAVIPASQIPKTTRV